MNQPRKDAEVIKAFADGVEIQYKWRNEWYDWGQDIGMPPFDTVECRVKNRHQAVKDAYDAGAKIQKRGLYGQWFDIGTPQWLDNFEYRIAPDPFADLKKAFAEGKTIQYSYLGGWRDIETKPMWDNTVQYRVKPEPDPYQELKDAFNAGKVIQMQLPSGRWEDIPNPSWEPQVKHYRIKPDPYQHLKDAHAAGKAIQLRDDEDDTWWTMDYTPSWSEPVEDYRVKPIERYYGIRYHEPDGLIVKEWYAKNLRVEIDPATHEILSANIFK